MPTMMKGGELALVDQGGGAVSGVPADTLFQRGKEHVVRSQAWMFKS